MNTVTIRASSLGTHADCMSRGIAQSCRKVVEAAGYELRAPVRRIGAVIGTSVHASACHTLQAMKDGRALPSVSDAEEVAIEEYRSLDRGGEQFFDNLTPNVPEAHRQILAMARTHYHQVAPVSNPIMVEQRLWCAIGNRVILTGQPDSIEPRLIQDIKTGRPSSFLLQMGSYGLLSESNGIDIDAAEVIGIPRPRRGKPVEMYRDRIDGETLHHGAVPAVLDTIERIITNLDRVQAGDPVLDVNPASSMCSRKMCPAWGTRFCIATHGKD